MTEIVDSCNPGHGQVGSHRKEPKDTYSYTPLAPKSAEIRLLTIQPGLWDADIKCELQHAFLDSNPSYEALSYTWGDANELRQISLGGHPWNVSANLEAGLRYLRHEDEPRIMWIDALCVNQGDLKERSEQVPKMWEIYASASDVVAWLGPPGEQTDAAMEAIEEIAMKYCTTDDEIETSTVTPDDLLQAGLDTSTINWDAIWSILERPYWERVWAIQELATCGINNQDRGTIMCGLKSKPKWMFDMACSLLALVKSSAGFFDGQRFAEPMQTMLARGMPPGLRMFTTLVQYDDSADNSEDRNLAWLVLAGTCLFKASDPRDKLYGVLSLARREDAIAITPNYSKPLHWIFTDFIKSQIQRDKSLACLLFNRTKTNGFGPSWIPDIYNRFDSGAGWVDEERLWRAAADLECDVEFRLDDQSSLLIAKGVKVGVLDTVIGPFELDGRAARLLAAGYDIGEEMFVPQDQLSEFAQTLSDSAEHECLWRTLVMDMDISDWDNPVYPAPQRLREGYELMIGLTDIPGDFEPDLPQESRDFEFVRASGFGYNFGQTTVSRCFFRTANGKMGVGPYHAKPGDVVVALFGATRFLVLQPKELNYELVGDAYVQGGMFGEFVQDAEARAERFVLC